MEELLPGDVFRAFNSDMDAFTGKKKGKEKLHLYLRENEYYIINSKPPTKGRCFAMKEQDCELFTKDCYINTTWPQCRDISTFEIIKKTKLPREVILNLIEHIKVIDLTRRKIREFTEALQKAL